MCAPVGAIITQTPDMELPWLQFMGGYETLADIADLTERNPLTKGSVPILPGGERYVDPLSVHVRSGDPTSCTPPEVLYLIGPKTHKVDPFGQHVSLHVRIVKAEGARASHVFEVNYHSPKWQSASIFQCDHASIGFARVRPKEEPEPRVAGMIWHGPTCALTSDLTGAKGASARSGRRHLCVRAEGAAMRHRLPLARYSGSRVH